MNTHFYAYKHMAKLMKIFEKMQFISIKM